MHYFPDLSVENRAAIHGLLGKSKNSLKHFKSELNLVIRNVVVCPDFSTEFPGMGRNSH